MKHHHHSHHTYGFLGIIEGFFGLIAILFCISVLTTEPAHKAHAAAEQTIVVKAHSRSGLICQADGWWADGDAYQHGKRLVFHWNHLRDRRIARADGGKVVFDGITLQNRSDVRVRFVYGRCEH